MQRRDFLKGSAGLLAASLSDPVSAQELVNPKILELIRFHWCYGHPKLRRNIYSLYNSNPNHPTILAYAQAVSVMKGRPASDATSWLYQANIHGTNAPVGGWPPGAPWSTCDHGFHFLSWHRMYLFFFERIVRAASGDPNFALPYWDYAPAANRMLPPPFRNPNNATNPLWDGTRPGMNAGGTLPASAVELDDLSGATQLSRRRAIPTVRPRNAAQCCSWFDRRQYGRFQHCWAGPNLLAASLQH